MLYKSIGAFTESLVKLWIRFTHLPPPPPATAHPFAEEDEEEKEPLCTFVGFDGLIDLMYRN